MMAAVLMVVMVLVVKAAVAGQGSHSRDSIALPITGRTLRV